MEKSLVILVAFVLYLLLMLLIGWYFYQRTQNVADYIIAGRGLNSWVTSLSAQASDMSGWLMMGLPGYAYTVGLEASWIAIGLFVGTFLNWQFVAKKLRVETERLNAITIPSYFESRFNDRRHILRIISSIFIVIFFLIYTSSGFVAGAKLFNSIFNVDYHWALIITAAIIIGYTYLGGLNAVSWTDFFQGLLMFAAIITVPLVTYLIIERSGSFINILRNDFSGHLLFCNPNKNMSERWIIVASNLAWGLGYFGQPHILTRFMAIKQASLLKRSRNIAIVWVFISLLFAVIVGIVGRVFFTDGIGDPEGVFLMLANLNFPPLFAGILLAAILAAVMSTADSQLLVTSSSISEDLINVIWSKRISDKHLLLISRMSVLIVSIISVGIAWNPESSVLDLVAYAWAGFGASFGPLILISLYWKGMTLNGAIVSIWSGAITVLVWNRLSGGIFDLYEIIPGFIISSFSGILVSVFNYKKYVFD